MSLLKVHQNHQTHQLGDRDTRGLRDRRSGGSGTVGEDLQRCDHLRAKPSCTQRTGEHAILQSMNRHPRLHQEIPHKAEKHLLSRQSTEGNKEFSP